MESPPFFLSIYQNGCIYQYNLTIYQYVITLVGNVLNKMKPFHFDGLFNIEKNLTFIGLETNIYGERWNIDIWLKSREEIEAALLSEDKLMRLVEERPECKKAILDIKQELARLKLYGFDKKQNHYHSNEIYDAVLFNNVISIEQFFSFMHH